MQDNNKMTHCPKCRKPLLNGAKFMGNAQFNLRCPWCQSIVTVTVQQQIFANLKTPDVATPAESPELADFYNQASSEPATRQEKTFLVNSTESKTLENGLKLVGYLYSSEEADKLKSS